MGPKGKNKKLALKQSYLGHYNKNVKSLSQMDSETGGIYEVKAKYLRQSSR